jgi:hypothetical protein
MTKFHISKPGPIYWDFKCLICGEDVNGHFTRNLLALIKGKNK